MLADAGLEAVHGSTIGPYDAPDSTIMAHAIEAGCIVLTHDLDFSAILAATHGRKPSVGQIRADDVSPEAIGQHVTIALRQLEAELEDGALVTLDAHRARLRLLSLRARP